MSQDRCYLLERVQLKAPRKKKRLPPRCVRYGIRTRRSISGEEAWWHRLFPCDFMLWCFCITSIGFLLCYWSSFQKKQTKKIFDEKCLRIFLRCDFTVFSTKLNFVILLIKSTLTEIENPSEDQVFFTTFEGQVSGMIFW